MMSIHSIAAGGGSIIRFDGARLRVGPESAGADPGPASYRRGGPLTITDANVLLGRIQPAFFPQVFGAAANQPLDRGIVAQRFDELARRMSARVGRADQTRAESPPGHCKSPSAAWPTPSSASPWRAATTSRATRCSASAARAASMPAWWRTRSACEHVFCHPLAGVLSRLRHGLGRPDRDARGGARAGARRRQASPQRARTRGAPWAARRRAELAASGRRRGARAQRGPRAGALSGHRYRVAVRAAGRHGSDGAAAIRAQFEPPIAGASRS